MTAIPYIPPVSALLSIGKPISDEWPSYPLQYGLSAADKPELLRMALDPELYQADSESSAVFAPLHAWRALGQLGAVEAVGPLLGLLRRIDVDEDDWVEEDLPQALALIGPAATLNLASYLVSAGNPPFARMAAADALVRIGAAYPAARDDCVRAFSVTLEDFAKNDRVLNSFLVQYLADLNAVEVGPLVERTFASGRAGELDLADWEDWQVAVGLLAERRTPLEDDWAFDPVDLVGALPTTPLAKKSKGKKDKAKRKLTAKSRKKNRKK